MNNNQKELYDINDFFFNVKYKLIGDLVDVLYDTEGCSDGGLCHKVIEENNLDDHSLRMTIKQCNKAINDDCIDKELSASICKLLLQITYEQRVILFEVRKLLDIIDETTWNLYVQRFDIVSVVKEKDTRPKKVPKKKRK